MCSNPTSTPVVPDNHAALEPGPAKTDEPLSTTAADSPASSVLYAPPTSHHLIVTRSKDGTRRPYVLLSTVHALPEALSVTVIMPTKPTCYSQAIRYPEWRATMVVEFDALIRNGT